MKKINIRDLMTPADLKLFLYWVQNTTGNCFDPDILTYQKTALLSADDTDGPFMYLPMQMAIMLESLAVMAGTNPRKEALALAKFGHAIDEIAAQTGIGEVYFLCKDDNVADICKRHGYEELFDFRILRRKIKRGTIAEDSSAQTPQNVE